MLAVPLANSVSSQTANQLVCKYVHRFHPVAASITARISVRVEITQSEVDQNFAMFVPVFADFGQGWVRLGQLALAGNCTRAAIFSMDRQPKKVGLNVYKDVLER